jgi:hypothetical protein
MSDVKRLVLIESIRRDAEYVGRLISSTRSGTPAESMPTITFAIANFLAMFTLEGRKHSALTAGVFDEPELSADFDTAVNRSRQILKLFEDNRKDIKAQISFFEEELISAHQKRFLGNTWLPVAWSLETDLGLAAYDGVPITSTHSANLALGEEPNAMFEDGANARRYAISVEYGKFFASRGARIDPEATSFASHLDPKLIAWRDVKSWRVYPSLFNGPESPGLNAWLQVLQMWVNFTNAILTRDAQNQSFYTTCKLQYLTLYAVTRSLNLLAVDSPVNLTDTSRSAIEKIANLDGASLFVSDSGRMLRNTLMHYNPDSRIDDVHLDTEALLFGLSEALFDGMTPLQFREAVDEWGRRVRLLFNAWTAG